MLCLLLSAGQPAVTEESWESLDKEFKRAKINAEAKAALDQVLAKSQSVGGLYGKAYGRAAFDNLKIAIGWSGGGGNGVAVNKGSGARNRFRVGKVRYDYRAESPGRQCIAASGAVVGRPAEQRPDGSGIALGSGFGRNQSS